MPFNWSFTDPDAHVFLREVSKSGVPKYDMTDLSNGGMQVPYEGTIGSFDYKGATGTGSPLYAVGSMLRNMTHVPGANPVINLAQNGPVVSGAVGAGLGFLAGKGMQYAGFEPAAVNGYTPLILGTGLAALLALSGHAVTKKYTRKVVAPPYTTQSNAVGMKKSSNMNKSAAMYHDARNFILEKLQGATDLGYVEKANLAAKIRNMNSADAERLKTALRAAAGFGIGQLISRFFFGARGSAAMQGGVIGALASLVSSAIKTNNVHSSMFQGSRYSY